MNDCVIEMLYDKCISWIDGELSSMSKTERMKLYDKYRWLFSSNCKQPDLESLIIGVDPRVNTFRSKFREWFFVVCNYSFSPYHFGQTSYFHFMNAPHWTGSKSKGNKVYPQRVVLTLGMMGVFTAPQEPADYQRVFFFRPTFRPTFGLSAPYCVVLQNTASTALCWRF